MRLVHATFDQNEALLVRTQLERQGLHPFVQGANHGSLIPSAGLIELRILVPAEEVDRALRWLEGSTIVLDQTEPTGESLADAVCPVHEQVAVATCSRCGTFLCGRCGSLGTPPLCEACVAFPTEASPPTRWAGALVRVWLVVGVISVVCALVMAWLVAGRR